MIGLLVLSIRVMFVRLREWVTVDWLTYAVNQNYVCQKHMRSMRNFLAQRAHQCHSFLAHPPHRHYFRVDILEKKIVSCSERNCLLLVLIV